jgi:hypothetical protein
MPEQRSPVVADAAGNLYFFDVFSKAMKEFSPTSGLLRAPFVADLGSPTTSVTFAVSIDGDMYLQNLSSGEIFRVKAGAQRAESFAGHGNVRSENPAQRVAIPAATRGMSFAAGKLVLMTESNELVFIDGDTGVIQKRTRPQVLKTRDNAIKMTAGLDGSIYLLQGGVRKMAAESGAMTTIVGTLDPASTVSLDTPTGMAQGKAGIPVSESVAAGLLRRKVEVSVYSPETAQSTPSGTKVQVVRLEFLVLVDGSTTAIRVVSPPQEADQGAIAAVAQWKYRTYIMDGKPTTMRVVTDLKVPADAPSAPLHSQPKR